MAGLVLDASVMLAALLQEHNAGAAADLIDRVADERAAVPGHWDLEVGNGLLMSECSGAIRQCNARLISSIGGTSDRT